MCLHVGKPLVYACDQSEATPLIVHVREGASGILDCYDAGAGLVD